MIRFFLAIVALIVLTSVSAAGIVWGSVLEVTPDAITIQSGGSKKLTFQVSNELLSNTIPYYPCLSRGAKFRDVKKGDKVQLDCVTLDDHEICTWIHLENPDDAGVVIEVGKDTIMIRNDKGKTTTYKVAKELVDNTREDKRYTTNYPSHFADVKPGCRIEVNCYREDGHVAISEMDVKQKEKKDK